MLTGLGLMQAGMAIPYPHGKLSLLLDTFCLLAGLWIYTGLLVPDTFLLHSRAPELHWTFPDLPEHRCYYLSFFPFVPKSILPWSRDPR